VKQLPLIFLLFFILVFCGASCRRTGGVTPNSVGIPWNLDSLMPSRAVVLPWHSHVNAFGIFVACKLTGNIVDTSGNVDLYSRYWETAIFKDNLHPVDGGMVSVNSFPLTNSSSWYTRHDSFSLWNESSLNRWQVSGSSGVPMIDTVVPGAMPSFIGVIPVTVDTSNDFTITFNSSNTTNADSAFFILSRGDETDPVGSTVVSASGGAATIKSALLKSIHNCSYCSLTGTLSDPFRYKGGLIMIVLYNHTTITLGGKQFAFVKQREYLGVVNFR
jgi:hypothetical protein